MFRKKGHYQHLLLRIQRASLELITIIPYGVSDSNPFHRHRLWKQWPKPLSTRLIEKVQSFSKILFKKKQKINKLKIEIIRNPLHTLRYLCETIKIFVIWRFFFKCFGLEKRGFLRNGWSSYLFPPFIEMDAKGHICQCAREINYTTRRDSVNNCRRLVGGFTHWLPSLSKWLQIDEL